MSRGLSCPLAPSCTPTSPQLCLWPPFACGLSFCRGGKGTPVKVTEAPGRCGPTLLSPQAGGGCPALPSPLLPCSVPPPPQGWPWRGHLDACVRPSGGRAPAEVVPQGCGVSGGPALVEVVPQWEGVSGGQALVEVVPQWEGVSGRHMLDGAWGRHWAVEEVWLKSPASWPQVGLGSRALAPLSPQLPAHPLRGPEVPPALAVLALGSCPLRWGALGALSQSPCPLLQKAGSDPSLGLLWVGAWLVGSGGDGRCSN